MAKKKPIQVEVRNARVHRVTFSRNKDGHLEAELKVRLQVEGHEVQGFKAILGGPVSITFIPEQGRLFENGEVAES